MLSVYVSPTTKQATEFDKTKQARKISAKHFLNEIAIRVTFNVGFGTMEIHVVYSIATIYELYVYIT